MTIVEPEDDDGDREGRGDEDGGNRSETEVGGTGDDEAGDTDGHENETGASALCDLYHTADSLVAWAAHIFELKSRSMLLVTSYHP